MQPQSKEPPEPLGLKQAGGALPESLQRKHGPAITLILDFWPSELLENKCLLF